MITTRITTVGLIVAIGIVVAGRTASAAPAPTPRPGSTEPRASAPTRKSPLMATAMAVAPLALSAGLYAGAGAAFQHDRLENALIVAGTAMLMIGPSAGHFYAGDVRGGLITSGLRIASLGAGIAAVHLWSTGCTFYCGPKDEPPSKAASSTATGLVAAGGIAFVGATLYDIFHASAAAREHNAGLSLMPTVVGSSSAPGYGLALGGSF